MENPFRQPIPKGTRLIETFLFAAGGEGVRRKDMHLARLQRSAQRLGFALDIEAARAKIDAIDCDSDVRCRLTVGQGGDIEIIAAPMVPHAPEWRLAIASQRLNSQDPWLAHKTTQRALYDNARANLPDGVEEVIFLNERDEVCEGTITNLFITTSGSGMLTPPLSSGVLPGILRQSLIEQGEARKAVIDLPLLEAASAIHVGNSLRGLIPARLIKSRDSHTA